MPATRAATSNVPQIKTVRLTRVDPVASKYQFRLGDGEVDLLKAFNLDGSDGIVGMEACATAHYSARVSG